METFDLAVIGAGPGGYPAAIRGAQLGASVAIVERESLGGTCLNWGCIPTKALLASSSFYHRMRQSEALGIKTGPVTFDYAAMVKRKDALVNGLCGGVEQLLKANGVRIFKGSASFLSPTRIAVGGREGSIIETKSVIIASGATSDMPSFIPRHERIVESRAFLGLTDLPATLIVLGGGVIGCELACMAAQLGVKVTISEMLPDILFMIDADVRREVRKSMEGSLGMTVLTGAPLLNIRADSAGVSGEINGQRISAEMMLAAVGRKPVTEGLALEKAGIDVTPSGHIEIDPQCQTRVAGIYAVGDVTAGSTQLAHAATAQGVIAAGNACGGAPGSATPLIPFGIFTEPEIGVVGLTAQKARALNLDVKTGRFLFASQGKAQVMGENSGFVKWIVDARTDRLLGAQAVGAHATELISEAAVAIHSQLTAKDLGRITHCHPTLSEAWMEAAHAVHGEGIHGAPRPKKR